MASGLLSRAMVIPTSKPKSLPTPAFGGGLVVECSSRPQKKATAHHMKTRPKKTQPWDIRRKGPTVYPPLPPLPPDWSFLAADDQMTTTTTTTTTSSQTGTVSQEQ